MKPKLAKIFDNMYYWKFNIHDNGTKQACLFICFPKSFIINYDKNIVIFLLNAGYLPKYLPPKSHCNQKAKS